MEDLWTAFFRPSTKRARRIADKTYLESWSKDPDSEATSEETTEARLARARRALREALRRYRGLGAFAPFPLLIFKQLRRRTTRLRYQISAAAQEGLRAPDASVGLFAAAVLAGGIGSGGLMSLQGVTASINERALSLTSVPVAAITEQLTESSSSSAIHFPRPERAVEITLTTERTMPRKPPAGAHSSTEIRRGIGISVTRTTSAWLGDYVEVREEEPIWIYCDPANPAKQAACDAYDQAGQP